MKLVTFWWSCFKFLIFGTHTLVSRYLLGILFLFVCLQACIHYRQKEHHLPCTLLWSLNCSLTCPILILLCFVASVSLVPQSTGTYAQRIGLTRILCVLSTQMMTLNIVGQGSLQIRVCFGWYPQFSKCEKCCFTGKPLSGLKMYRNQTIIYPQWVKLTWLN